LIIIINEVEEAIPNRSGYNYLLWSRPIKIKKRVGTPNDSSTKTW